MDKRALKILLNAFWSSAGLRKDALQNLPPEEFEYAKAKGVMFDPLHTCHSQAVADLLEAIRNLTRAQVVDAFLASLSTRRLDWRSALGSYAVFQHLGEHDPIEWNGRCAICGMYLKESVDDLNVLNFERLKWGGVRHDQVLYGWFDLKSLRNEDAPRPTAEDVAIFRELIGTIAAVPENTTSSQLQAALPKALKSNKSEREVVIAILGYSGILAPPEHPGYSDQFVPASKRELPNKHFVDMPYPACWWQAEYGLNQNKLKEYFGPVL